MTPPASDTTPPPDETGQFVLRHNLDEVTKPEIAAWAILGAALLLVFHEHLVPAFVVGMLFYLVLYRTSNFLKTKIQRRAVRRPIALVAATSMIVALLVGVGVLVVEVVRRQINNIPALLTKMAEILESTRILLVKLGGYAILPEAVRDAEDFKAFVVQWLKAHSVAVSYFGETFSVGLAHIVLALLLAAMVFLRHTSSSECQTEECGPLRYHLVSKIRRLTNAFSQVVSAQLRISAINTSLTAIYLLVVLPIFHRPLPFSKTIVLVTFVSGLIPVVGNLISNTIIVIVSFGISVGTAIASLAFLVGIHKLEYIVNSKIVGSKTDSQVWEILLAIILGEVTFGIPGIIMAPIVYTFVKGELLERKLV